MALVYYDKEIIIEIIYKTLRRFPWLLISHVPTVVFNAGTEACFPKHFYIKISTLRYSLSFYQLIL